MRPFLLYLCKNAKENRQYMLRYLFFTILSFCFTVSIAQNAIEDFDTLSKLSSEQLMDRGRTYFSQHKANKALACFTIVSERYKHSNNTEEIQQSIRALNNCGCVYQYNYSDYPQAYEAFTRAYELCEQHHYDDFLPVILVNLSDLLNDYSIHYGSLPLSQQATDTFDQCIEKAVETKNWELLTTAFFNLANQNYELDLKKYDVIFSEDIPDNTPDLEYVRLQYRGIELLQQKKYDEARQQFNQQLEVINTRWEPSRDTLSTYQNIAKTYQLEKDYPQEAHYLEKAYQVARNEDAFTQCADICKQLSFCYKTMGDTVLQQHYHLLYLEKMEEIRQKRLNNIAELNYIYELRKEETKAQTMLMRQRIQQYAIITVLVFLIIAILMAFQLWKVNRELQAKNKSLFEKYQQSPRINEKYSHSNLNNDQRETLIARIQEVFSDPNVICQQDFTSSQLAKLIGSNTTYVSQVINETYGMTFSILLSSRRVRIACQWMEDPARIGSITIEAIASASGFKSRTAFINAFKRETGLTPSDYIRFAASKSR